MTLPISLTCKTQEPSRTRTLRGTRGTSSGGGGRRGGGGGGAACLGRLAAGPCGGTFGGCWSRRPASPAGTLTRGHPGGVPGSEASAAGRPGTILDQACSPGMPAQSKPAFLPILLLAPRCPSSCISALARRSPLPWWLVGGGDVREGAPARSPSSPPPQPPFRPPPG